VGGDTSNKIAAKKEAEREAKRTQEPGTVSRALGVVSEIAQRLTLTTVCPQIYQQMYSRPLRLMNVGDLQRVQACNENGVMLPNGVYVLNH